MRRRICPERTAIPNALSIGRRFLRISSLLAVVMGAAVTPAWSQTIQAEGDIETDGCFISTAASGTAPLAVASTTRVSKLNADLLDGRHSFDFALYADLWDLQSEVGQLDNPDPPCYDNEHRFVDCGNGTVTDTLTGLIWLKQVDCFPAQTFAEANTSVAGLRSGDCGLSDGSRPGDWRIPSVYDCVRLFKSDCAGIDIAGNGPNDSSCYFYSPWATGLVEDYYWTSTTYNGLRTWAYMMQTEDPEFIAGYKAEARMFWPVRGVIGLIQ